MKSARLWFLVCSIVALGCVSPGLGAATGHEFRVGEDSFLLDGRPLQIRCGEIHAARVPQAYWRHRLRMAKAMGLNAVCAYLFWNQHEPRPGEFVWTGQADLAEFCRIAQQEGLWVILRPGPYACAEWEMGGLPSWLLKEPDIKLRSRDPRFLTRARSYLQEVGRVLAPLQVSRGGPILMVQVENEYGFFGDDTEYMRAIKDQLLAAGFDVPLFACSPKDVMQRGHCPEILLVANFGNDPKASFEALRKFSPKGPLMCGEFYPGWFDTWGQPHSQGNLKTYLADLETMLRLGASFSIYMAHGGTSFGFSSGADRPFKPDTSSYDYDAPVSEAGWVTPKFFATRELFSKFLQPGETLPEPPAPNPVIRIPAVLASGFASLMDTLPAPIKDSHARTMEAYDQAYGCILYRYRIPSGPREQLQFEGLHDIGQVYLDGKLVGHLDRRLQQTLLDLPARGSEARLDILVEAMGRVNFGAEVHDHKGIVGGVQLGGKPLGEVEVFRLPFDEAMMAGVKYSSKPAHGPAFYRATVHVEKAGDCFLDMRPWGKGYAWVNGHHLGRFWNIGPQQTMYLPGVWLRPGDNELVIFDLNGPQKPEFSALDTPILNELRPELDFARKAAGDTPATQK